MSGTSRIRDSSHGRRSAPGGSDRLASGSNPGLGFKRESQSTDRDFFLTATDSVYDYQVVPWPTNYIRFPPSTHQSSDWPHSIHPNPAMRNTVTITTARPRQPDGLLGPIPSRRYRHPDCRRGGRTSGSPAAPRIDDRDEWMNTQRCARNIERPSALRAMPTNESPQCHPPST